MISASERLAEAARVVLPNAGFELQIARALISMMARSNELQSEAGCIYGQPRLRKGNFVPAPRLPAVIYPVCCGPEGIRGSTPDH